MEEFYSPSTSGPFPHPGGGPKMKKRWSITEAGGGKGKEETAPRRRTRAAVDLNMLNMSS